MSKYSIIKYRVRQTKERRFFRVLPKNIKKYIKNIWPIEKTTAPP
jgi:hypothetical protein